LRTDNVYVLKTSASVESQVSQILPEESEAFSKKKIVINASTTIATKRVAAEKRPLIAPSVLTRRRREAVFSGRIDDGDATTSTQATIRNRHTQAAIHLMLRFVTASQLPPETERDTRV